LMRHQAIQISFLLAQALWQELLRLPFLGILRTSKGE